MAGVSMSTVASSNRLLSLSAFQGQLAVIILLHARKIDSAGINVEPQHARTASA
jgi:hypothetical protein